MRADSDRQTRRPHFGAVRRGRSHYAADAAAIPAVASLPSCAARYLVTPYRYQGCSPKKEVGGRLKQDVDKDFFNNLGRHTCCTEIILHCVSVSNQLQQWTNFCTNFSPKKWREWGTRPPCRQKVGDAVLPRPRPTTLLLYIHVYSPSW